MRFMPSFLIYCIQCVAHNEAQSSMMNSMNSMRSLLTGRPMVATSRCGDCVPWVQIHLWYLKVEKFDLWISCTCH